MMLVQKQRIRFLKTECYFRVNACRFILYFCSIKFSTSIKTYCISQIFNKIDTKILRSCNQQPWLTTVVQMDFNDTCFSGRSHYKVLQKSVKDRTVTDKQMDWQTHRQTSEKKTYSWALKQTLSCYLLHS